MMVCVLDAKRYEVWGGRETRRKRKGVRDERRADGRVDPEPCMSN
jgi:hypothetical protein